MAGAGPDDWSTSLDRADYLSAVDEVQSAIAAGTVYQANVCRVLSAPLPEGSDLDGLALRFAAGNPAPYSGLVSLPDHGVEVVTASPELFLSRDGPAGRVRRSRARRRRRTDSSRRTRPRT